MKIIIVGSEGDIGKAVCEELGRRHEIITAGRSSGNIYVDLTNRTSIDAVIPPEISGVQK